MSSKPALGLYFTDKFVEISALSSDGKKLLRYNYLFLPPGLVVNGEIKDTRAFVVLLKQLLSTAKPSPIGRNEDTVIGVSENRVFFREFSVPNLPGKNIEDAIDYQVRLLLPVLPSNVITDWQIIGKDSNGQIEVLLAAVEKSLVDSYVSFCKVVGLRVIAVEPAVFGNIRIISPEQVKDKNQLLVHLGDDYGSFSFITGGNPRFSEIISDAEIKKNGGVTKTVLTYINFANSKHETRPVEEVIVSGFSEEIDASLENLKTEKLKAVKAVSRLAGKSVMNRTLLHTAYGLSLKFLDTQESLNLLPQEYRLSVVRDRLLHRWKAILTLLIVLSVLGIAGLGYLYQGVSVQETRLAMDKKQFELSEDKPLIEQGNDLNALTNKLVTLREITGGEERILETISSIAPEGISLSSLQFTRSPGSKKLLDEKNSWIVTGSANSRPLVLNFYKSLISQPGFSEGKLYFGSLEKDTEISFRIASHSLL